MRKEFKFDSADGRTQIRVVIHVPKVPEGGVPKGVVQIVHGMCEYIDRYEEFASFLEEQGYVVIGHDHLGHGQSIVTQEDWGYFADVPHPSDVLVEDIHKVRSFCQNDQYPKVPYFILGHSMGSYLLRKYLAKYGEGLDGAVVMGTGYVAPATTKFGLFMIDVLKAFHGDRYRSQFMLNMSQGGPYKKFDVTGKNPENSWLSKNVENVQKYYKDPRCTFLFTLNGYKGLLESVLFDCTPSHVAEIPKSLPVFLVSGQDDPVGDLGEGVLKVEKMFKEAGMTDVACKLYLNDRHEILNELDREEVYADILGWMEKHIS